MITKAEVEALIPSVMAQYPTLGHYGFNREAKPYPHRASALQEVVVDFRYGTPGEFHTDSIAKAMAWLDEINFASTNRAFKWASSYGMKHWYESWYHNTHDDYDYLANGDFIVAAILSGLRIKWQPAGGPNAHVAVSTKRHREFFSALRTEREIRRHKI